MKAFFLQVLGCACALSACSELHGDRDQSLKGDVAHDGAPAAPSADNASDASVAADSDTPPLSPSVEVPASWQRVTGNCGISLRAPALVAKPSQGTDSCVAKFQGPDCAYSADQGWYSDDLRRYEGDAQYATERVRVGDKQARLVMSRGRLEDQQFFVGIYIPAPIGPESSTASVTVSATCFSASGRDTARIVLQTLELPADDAASLRPLDQTVSCAGEDIRQITGYRLGRACVDDKVAVPGVCALGAKAHGATGNGPMVCFVSPDGHYFWAHVAYGEYIAGPGSRHGVGAVEASELTAVEEIQCTTLVNLLQDGVKNSLSGEFSYARCTL